jgi:hypothetical protein
MVRLSTVVGVAAGLLALVLTGCGSGVAPAPVVEETYGGLPTFLPSGAPAPDAVLSGSAARPALTTEGDAVRVQFQQGSVLVTVTGPEVPGEGLPFQAAATTCTWTVTMTGATAPVPIAVADFTTIDHLGHIYRPSLVPGQPAPPAVLATGQSVTFELRVVMTVGEGLMRWAPGQQQIVASWDFEVEND